MAHRAISGLLVLSLSTAMQLAPETACLTWYDTIDHGPAFRNVKDFGAVGDGNTDDTNAIQRAIDQGRGGEGDLAKKPAVVYLPPGNYLVSDTLVLWWWTHFRGSVSCPPTISLKPNAAGFADTKGYKPVIATTAGYNTSTNQSWWGKDIDANCNFYTQLHNIRVIIGKGNSGAVGVIWRVAQQTSIRNLTIDATEGAVGLDVGAPAGYWQFASLTPGGGGTVENVIISGGRFGLRGSASQWLLRNVRVENSTEACMQIWPWVFTLLNVVSANCPVGLQVIGARNLVVIDSTFTNISSGAGTAIVTDGNPIVLDRVTVIQAAYVVDRALPCMNSRTTHVASWRQGPANLSYLRGVQLPDSSPHGHLPPQRPDFPLPIHGRPAFGPTVASITHFGGKGDGVTDDTHALQNAIDASGAVFLPFGTYLISDTVYLKSTTQIVGEGLTRIVLKADSGGFDDLRAPKAMLLTPDDAAAEVILADLMIESQQGNPGAVLVHWMAGARSGCYDVTFRIYHPVSILLHITGNGGGIMSNMWGWGADHNQTTMDETHIMSPVGLRVESMGPLWLLGTAFEHHTDVNYHFRGASNIIVAGMQTENPYWKPFADVSTAVVVQNTSNALLFGALYCNWFGSAPSLVNYSAVTNVSMYAVVFNGASVALHGDNHDVKGGVVEGYGAMVSDTPL